MSPGAVHAGPNVPLGIGLDTGGTFTDIVLYDLGGEAVVRKAKTPTTHADYGRCVQAAFDALALTPAEAAALRRVALSTTLATNAVAENKVHPTGLVIEPGDIRVPPEFHPHLALLRSQLSFDIHEVTPVSREEVLAKVSPWAHQVEGFAVSGYAATRDPRHEQEIGEILHAEFGKPVVLGSQLTHRLNFMERARAAALNAGLLPVILEWLAAIRTILERHRIAAPLYLVKGDGSLMEAEAALRMPVHTLHSGPAASLQGGSRLADRQDAIVIDVGGTTTDMGRVRRGMGLLREGGVRINGRAVAVDGLDLATFGLGGDSRLRRVGSSGYRFENRRVLPVCRAAARYPGFSVAALEAEVGDQWHFADLELLEYVARDTEGTAETSGMQREILEALAEGPVRTRALSRRFPLAGFSTALAELMRRRQVVGIAFTPTDLFCAEGRVPAFSQADAHAALRLYARMVDTTPEAFAEALWEAIRRQTAALLIGFLAELEPEHPAEARVLERLGAMATDRAEAGRARIDPVPEGPLVLVGAGAPLLFARAPAALQPFLLVPEHGDVANAVGAIASRFVLRDSATLEPVRYGGVELFDHHGKRFLPSLEAGLAEARATLEGRLRAEADAVGLVEPRLEFHEEIVEDYADFARRVRRELVLARVEAVLTGLPG